MDLFQAMYANGSLMSFATTPMIDIARLIYLISPLDLLSQNMHNKTETTIIVMIPATKVIQNRIY